MNPQTILVLSVVVLSIIVALLVYFFLIKGQTSEDIHAKKAKDLENKNETSSKE